jgi:hypothetical protein
MCWMVFQASRRQLLAHLIDYIEQYESGKEPLITIRSLPPDSTTPSSTSDSASASSKAMIVKSKPLPNDDDLTKKKLENLKRAVRAADDEVKKMEFWSDVKDVVRQSHNVGAEDAGMGWHDELGISGPSIGNENIFNQASGTVGREGSLKKGKEISR